MLDKILSDIMMTFVYLYYSYVWFYKTVIKIPPIPVFRSLLSVFWFPAPLLFNVLLNAFSCSPPPQINLSFPGFKGNVPIGPFSIACSTKEQCRNLYFRGLANDSGALQQHAIVLKNKTHSVPRTSGFQ